MWKRMLYFANNVKSLNITLLRNLLVSIRCLNSVARGDNHSKWHFAIENVSWSLVRSLLFIFFTNIRHYPLLVLPL